MVQTRSQGGSAGVVTARDASAATDTQCGKVVAPMRAPLASLFFALAAAACTAETSKECREVCARQDECEDKAGPESHFDEGECVAACAALQRDRETEGLVQRHVDCVAQAKTCEAVLACH
jgi:hypothetical protein